MFEMIPKRWRKPHWRLLCYHAVPAGWTDRLRIQLRTFAELGFTFLDLDTGLEACATGFAAPSLTLTFDDGDSTLYENVLPLLAELNIPAFLYVTTDYIRKGTTYRDEAPLQALNRAQLREWVAAGHGVGSHTVTHAPLPLCGDARLRHELTIGKDLLEQWLQVPVEHFSYPWGQHSRRTHEIIKNAGLFKSAATIDRGMMTAGHDPHRLRRDVCSPEMLPRALIKKMRCADHWYWLRRLRPKRRGYWDEHPEESWSEIEGALA